MTTPKSRTTPNMRQRPVLDIFIAHHHEITRIGLRTLLKGVSGLRVCGESSTAADTLKKVKELQPHILLLKLRLPDKDALEIIPELLRLRPGLKIMLYAAEGPTMDSRDAALTPAIAKRALGAGVLGLVLRPDAQDIRYAVDALSNNKAFISSNIFEGVANEVARRIERLPSIGDLTGREVEVLKRMAIGNTTKEIAADLHNSPRTIEVHRANIMHKLGFHSQADLIMFALQHNVAEHPQPAKVQ